jgi:hypothetical protein
VIAQLAKEAGALVLGVMILPFDWEGSRRQQQAAEALQVLKALADSVICISNQTLLKLIDENTSVIEAFDIINRYVEEGVRSVWRLLTCPSLIRVDFGDLCAVTRGRHSESCLATAEAAGPNRARDLVERLMNHPLLDNGQALAEAETLLVSLVGGPDLSIAEVSRVMDQVRRHAERAQVIAGTAIDEASGPVVCHADCQRSFGGRWPCPPGRPDSSSTSPMPTAEEIQTRQVRQASPRRAGRDSCRRLPSCLPNNRNGSGTAGRTPPDGTQTAAAAGRLATRDCLPRSLREERTDHLSRRRPGRAHVHPAWRGIELTPPFNP